MTAGAGPTSDAERIATTVVADGQILRRVRAGELDAFGELFERHHGVARRVARSLVASPAEADDVVAEVFAATLAAIRRGSGPAEDFRPYVLRAVRRECQRTWRRGARNVQLVADAAPSGSDDFARHDEQDLLRQAFAGLPVRMQAVLWQTEVEGRSHAEVARGSRATPQAIAQLAVRARRLLGDRYLQAHVPGSTAGELPAACGEARESLAAVVRGTASDRRRLSVEDHVAQCAPCAATLDDLRLVNERLRGLTLAGLASQIGAPQPWVAGLLVRLGAMLTPAVQVASVVGLVAVASLTPAALDTDAPADAAAMPPVAAPGAVASVPGDVTSGRSELAPADDGARASRPPRPATVAQPAVAEGGASPAPADASTLVPSPVPALTPTDLDGGATTAVGGSVRDREDPAAPVAVPATVDATTTPVATIELGLDPTGAEANATVALPAATVDATVTPTGIDATAQTPVATIDVAAGADGIAVATTTPVATIELGLDATGAEADATLALPAATVDATVTPTGIDATAQTPVATIDVAAGDDGIAVVAVEAAAPVTDALGSLLGG